MKKNRMPSWILLNPGPVNVTARVRRALLQPDICHREKEFSDLLRNVREKLLRIFRISKTHTAAFLTGSGTTALEAMLTSRAASGKILVLSNGVYGERIRTILERRGVPVKTLSSPMGDFPSLERIERALKQDRALRAVAMVHHETSSGMLNPLSAVGTLAKKYGKTFLIDAISSLGAESIDFKKDGVDFCAGTSGKCLHAFPGVSFVIVSKKEVRNLRRQKPASLALDLANALDHQERNDVPFTPAVQLFYALDRALDELKEEGLSGRIADYAYKNSLLQEGFSKLNLRFLIPKERRSHVLTALWTPSFISYSKLHDELKKKGFIIYAGQSTLKDKIFRVSNLGNIQAGGIQRFLSSLKTVLSHAKR
ncbi:MAG: aminotransferase class V-fold PLP-dependent enzyme [Candidatus Omnitrophica bacterium]|nr:aminotransferase class V-fold PLP-dependent enzyme [Candidatus Omnitrophota bacterium]